MSSTAKTPTKSATMVRNVRRRISQPSQAGSGGRAGTSSGGVGASHVAHGLPSFAQLGQARAPPTGPSAHGWTRGRSSGEWFTLVPLCRWAGTLLPTPFDRTISSVIFRPIEIRGQRLASVRLFHARDLFGRALGNDAAAFFSAFGAEIEDPVGVADYVEIMFDDDRPCCRDR